MEKEFFDSKWKIDFFDLIRKILKNQDVESDSVNLPNDKINEMIDVKFDKLMEKFKSLSGENIYWFALYNDLLIQEEIENMSNDDLHTGGMSFLPFRGDDFIISLNKELLDMNRKQKDSCNKSITMYIDGKYVKNSYKNNNSTYKKRSDRIVKNFTDTLKEIGFSDDDIKILYGLNDKSIYILELSSIDSDYFFERYNCITVGKEFVPESRIRKEVHDLVMECYDKSNYLTKYEKIQKFIKNWKNGNLKKYVYCYDIEMFLVNLIPVIYATNDDATNFKVRNLSERNRMVDIIRNVLYQYFEKKDVYYGKAITIASRNIDYINSDESGIYKDDLKNYLVEKYIDELDNDGKWFRYEVVKLYNNIQHKNYGRKEWEATWRTKIEG